jgi:hypothetical protein
MFLGNVQSFHFPYNIPEKILQIRRIDAGANKDDSESYDGFSASGMYIDISIYMHFSDSGIYMYVYIR